MQIRVLRRLTSLELAVEDVIKVEFWSRSADAPDLRTSTYLVADPGEADAAAETTRVLTEHAASFINPPRRVDALRVDHATPQAPEQTPGATAFSFANGRHHEYRFATYEDLLAFVSAALAAPDRHVEGRPGAALVAYAKDRLASNDPEWIAALKRGPSGAKWLAAIQGKG